MLDNHTELWPGWETVSVIGRGSFGTVYEIEREVFGQKEKAALKVITIPQNNSDIDELRSNGFDDESITDTFKSYLKNIVDEYFLMRKMNGNTNVVNCDDVRYIQHDDGVGWDIYIKMELVTPLTKAPGKPVPEEQVVQIGIDICKALVLCKKHDIVHRDIKPANIFVSENGDYKLGDFGIAKTIEKTSGGTKIGTYEYMAPEVYHDEPYGSSADIYSLGLVLYWLLNERRTPFLPLPPMHFNYHEKESAYKKRFGGASIPAPAHGSKELQQIVLKACAYRPEERFTDADAFLAALNKVHSTRRKLFFAEVEDTEAKVVGFVEVGTSNETVSVFYSGEPVEKTDPIQNSFSEADGLDKDETVGVFTKYSVGSSLIEDNEAGETISAFGATSSYRDSVEHVQQTAEQLTEQKTLYHADVRERLLLGKPSIEPKTWVCECGMRNTTSFCLVCFQSRPVQQNSLTFPDNNSAAENQVPSIFPTSPKKIEPWICECGKTNTTSFCLICYRSMPIPQNEPTHMEAEKTTGNKLPSESPKKIAPWICECGKRNTTSFCLICYRSMPKS